MDVDAWLGLRMTFLALNCRSINFSLPVTMQKIFPFSPLDRSKCEKNVFSGLFASIHMVSSFLAFKRMEMVD